jgi:pSer/pThr/pTyr-binding forkhead associated (FHA) protein
MSSEVRDIRSSRTPSEVDTLEVDHTDNTSRERLVIEYEGVQQVIDFPDGELRLGRGEDCDLIFTSQLTSRTHARISRSNARFFFLIDESRNGTFLKADGLGLVRIQRGERVPLIGSGLIGLGEVPRPGAEGTLRFKVFRPE